MYRRSEAAFAIYARFYSAANNYAYKPGHSLNRALMKQLFSDRSAWSYIAVDEFQQLFGEPIQAEQESEEVFLKQADIRQVL